MNYWLVKTEPSTYSWQNFERDGTTSWTGVRNFLARNNLRAMKKGDTVLVYHSLTEKAVVGTARVTKEAYHDATSTEDWSAVDLRAVSPLANPVSLASVKAQPELAQMKLVTHSRLSVMPITKTEYELILAMSAKA